MHVHNYNCIHLAKYVYIHMYAACTEKSAFVTPHAWRPKSAKHNRCMAMREVLMDVLMEIHVCDCGVISLCDGVYCNPFA